MTKLLMFQGDSITDAGRDRSDNHLLVGYPAMIKEKLQDAFEYINYAIAAIFFLCYAYQFVYIFVSFFGLRWFETDLFGLFYPAQALFFCLYIIPSV